jgi:4-amino-4-deoxy-L-arabinose transferase-like glycosyltransferase
MPAVDGGGATGTSTGTNLDTDVDGGSTTSATAPTAGRPISRRFVAVLALIAFLALAGRVVYVVAVTQGDHDLYDATYYTLQARSIAQGGGFFRDPFLQLQDPALDQPAADHPPLTVLAMLPAGLVEDPATSEFLMRLTMTLVGTAVVVGIGLLGRSLGGETVGLVAAGIAAVDPNLFMNDGLIMSESLAVLFTVAIVGLSYQVIRRGSTWWRGALLGVLCGLAVLTRAELGGLAPFLVVPALWVGSRRSLGSRPDDGSRRERGHDLGRVAKGVGAAVAASLIVVMPWVAFNMSRFQEPTTISTGDGLTLLGSNCEITYYGKDIGFASVFPPCVPWRENREQSVFNADNRHRGLSFIRHHLRRLPVVVVARVARAWNFFKLGQNAYVADNEGRPQWATYLGVVFTWISIPLAIAGGFVLRRRRVQIWPLVVPIVVATAAIAFVSGGLVRYRASAEPSMVVLVAVALVAWLGRRRPAADRPATDGPVDTATVGATGR